ncbi:GNAT family N-acetyltransferase [Lactiplantibacillus herbarum]|uniref:GNAT family N-acetyltransferase n=1 Tax=Lactiplantibacillus herbarum TaxID=1670446 RepID=UPI00064F8056|nr:GNAT family protein [Lactiplantibacillus herbarum]
MKFERLTQSNAQLIADHWHYPDEYAFYDATADPEDYEELVTPEQRGTNYYQALEQNQLIGYFVVEATDNMDEVEVGLGMAPDLTGQGNGMAFVRNVINEVLLQQHPSRIVLDVAKFNVRAQTVYQRLGFQVSGEHLQATNGGHYPFVQMIQKYPQ